MASRSSSAFRLVFSSLVCCLFAGCGDDGDGKGAKPTSTPVVATATPDGSPNATETPEATLTPTADSGGTETPTFEPTATSVPDDPIGGLPVDEFVGVPAGTAGLLAGTVHAVTDSLGMLHLYASERRSGLFIQGYETAKARFFQMDALRRVAEGRLSELFGSLTIGLDAEMRVVFTTRDGRRIEDALWERLQQEAPDLVEDAKAYPAGVNAWLADLRAGRNGATLPPEYGLINLTADDLDDWRPQDTLALGRLQAYSLSSSLNGELAAAERYAALEESLRLDVYRSAPAAPATVLPPAGQGGAQAQGGATAAPSLPPRSTLRSLVEMLAANESQNPLGGKSGDVGSNNWIVAPELSANGHAMMANDPHLALFNPAIWHMIQIDGGADGKVTGVNFPGLPGIILGHNDYGAWGGTVAVFDVTDIYMETVTTPHDYPASPRTVLFNGEQVEVLRIEEEIQLLGGESVPLVIEVVPHHGPMLPDPDLTDDVEGLAATNMTVRWTGHEVTLDARFLNDINFARNVEDFKEALRHFAVGAQNWVWADTSGDIAYFPYVLVPQRPDGTVPYLPMPGTGEAEWLTDEAGNTLWLPEEKFPQATNPPQGFLATANNDQIGNTLDNDPLNDEIYLTFSAAIGFRAQRIQNLLTNDAGVRPPGAKLSAADMSAYQYDLVSLEASRLVPFLLRAVDEQADLVTPAMTDALERLALWGESKEGSYAWDMTSGVDPADERDDVPPRTDPVTDEERKDAVASSIYAAWSGRLSRAVFVDDFAGTGIGAPGGGDATKALLHILEDIDRTDEGFVVHTKGPNGESTLWDDKNTPEVETRDEILLLALQQTIVFLTETFASDDPDSWLWGEIHRVRYTHFFDQADIRSFNLGDISAPGGRWTVNPANFSLNSDSFIFSSGPSMRFVSVLDPDGIRSVNIWPGGNNGNPGGAGEEFYNRIQPDIHYGDHVPGWINGEIFQVRETSQEVADDAETVIVYFPLP